jgi:hypothetical protein
MGISVTKWVYSKNFIEGVGENVVYLKLYRGEGKNKTVWDSNDQTANKAWDQMHRFKCRPGTSEILAFGLNQKLPPFPINIATHEWSFPSLQTVL